jgi:hypothetical protein
MNKRFATLLFLTIFSQISFSQNWKFMVETSLQITQRENKIYQFNDTTQVEIRDFGIDEFTIFTITNNRRSYYIQRFTCKCETKIFGGVARDVDFYHQVELNYNDGIWTYSKFESSIDLSMPWRFTKRQIKKRKRRCR